MKLSIPRKDLLSALATVKGAVTNKSTLPILHNVAITANQSSVEFAATDLDLTIRNRVDATVKKQGATTVSAAQLHGLVNLFTGDEVSLEILKGRLQVICGRSDYQLGILDIEEFPPRLQVICGRSDYQLGILDIEEFPPVTRLEEPKEFRLTQSALHTLLASTSFAIGSDAARYILCGSHFELNGSVTTACTDGRRLALNVMEAEDKIPKGEVTVPARAIKELLRLVPADEDEKRVTVAIGNNAVRFQFGETTVISKVIEGNYPNYRQVIPKWVEKESVTIARTDLLGALQRVALLTEDCSLQFAGQMLTVKGKGKDIDEAVETLLIPKVSKRMTITFRVRYLMEALAAVPDDEVRFYAEDNSSPGVLKAAGPWEAVIMPLRSVEQQEEADAKAKEQAEKAAAAQPPNPEETGVGE